MLSSLVDVTTSKRSKFYISLSDLIICDTVLPNKLLVITTTNQTFRIRDIK